MVLFPSNVLHTVIVYPAGHPFHRQAIVDLCRSQALIFHEFSERAAHTGREVVLRSGDVLLFPSF